MDICNILVVEDDPDINKLLCRILEGAGYACRPAFSGSEAALWAGQYEYDLVLLHNKNIALYRDTLYERVWGRDAELDTRTLDIHIHRLRKKLGWQQMIRTIPRVGYRLEETS